MRKCKDCGIEANDDSELELFARAKNAKYGRINKCKKCYAKHYRGALSKRYEKNRVRPDGYKEKAREFARKAAKRYKYGLSEDDFIALMDKFDNKCFICGQEHDLVIDHCHTTGNVRGILCRTCNARLGYYETDRIHRGNKFTPERAKLYLDNYKGATI